jgi:hypothetical protein
MEMGTNDSPRQEADPLYRSALSERPLVAIALFVHGSVILDLES